MRVLHYSLGMVEVDSSSPGAALPRVRGRQADIGAQSLQGGGALAAAYTCRQARAPTRRCAALSCSRRLPGPGLSMLFLGKNGDAGKVRATRR